MIMIAVFKNHFGRIQKVAVIALWICLFSLFASSLHAQTTEKVTWDYPLKYGSPEWSELKTVEEQFNAYNIPDEIIKNISTEELVKVCMLYPEWGLMNAYNSRQSGFGVLVSRFNGFQELFKRGDAAIVLMKEYDKLDPLEASPDWTPLQQGKYSFQFTKIEMFLCQKSMIDKLDNADIIVLKEMAVSKYQKKRMFPEIYSLWSISPTVGICVEIIKKEDAALFERSSEMNYFRHNLMTDDLSFLDSVVEHFNKN